MNFCRNDIYFILIFLVLGYLLYKDLTKEGFDTTDDIKTAVKTLYNADIQAIRNLSDIATKLVAGGLTVPGNLNVSGTLSSQYLNTPGITYGASKDGVSSTITDSKFEGNSLCIVGQDNPAGGRKINMWDHVEIKGNLTNLGYISTNNDLLLQTGKVIDFGSNDTTKELNAGKIGYNIFGDNLSIVGKGSKSGEPRRIKLWDNVDIQSKLSVNDNIYSNTIKTNYLNTPAITYGASKDNVSSTIADSIWEPSSLCIVGQDNPAGGRKITMWDNVQINGNLTINGGKIKIGSWTIQEDNGHIQFIKDGTVYTKGNAQYNDIPADTGFSAIAQDGNIWNNRSNGRGWVGDNTKEALNRIQNVKDDTQKQIQNVNQKSDDTLNQIQNVNKKSDFALTQSNDALHQLNNIKELLDSLIKRINSR